MGSGGDIGSGAGSAGGVAVASLLVTVVGEGSGVTSSVTEVGVCRPHADKRRQIEIVIPMAVRNELLIFATEDLLDLFIGFESRTLALSLQARLINVTNFTGNVIRF